MARRPIGKALAKAAAGPINLSVVGVAALGFLALGSWPILAIGGVAYAALVAADVTTPGFQRRMMLGRPEPAKMPREGDVADPEIRAAVVAIIGAADEVRKVAASTPARVRRHIETSLLALAELEGHAASLIERASAVARYLTASTSRR